MSTGQQWRRRAPLQELIDGLTGHITLVLEETDGLGVVCYYCSKPKYRYVSSESSPRIHPESTSTLKENYTIAQKKKKKKKKNLVGPCFAGQGTRRLLVSLQCSDIAAICTDTYAEPSPSSHYIKKSMVRKDTDDYANLAKAFLKRSTSL